MKKISILLFLLCPLCFADDESIARIAKNSFNKHLAELNIAEERCEKEERVVNASLFNTLKSDKKALKTAILYLYFKAKVKCSEQELKNFLLASAILGSIEDKESENITNSNHLMVMSNIQMIKLSSDYNALPENLRDSLDKITALKHPFNLIKTLEGIGIQ